MSIKERKKVQIHQQFSMSDMRLCVANSEFIIHNYFILMQIFTTALSCKAVVKRLDSFTEQLSLCC